MNNLTLFQFFHWYNTKEENIWKMAALESQNLSRLGITHVWLPPAYKSAYGDTEPGYAVYDLYDLGEFDQKGSVRTKWGTREEYLECIRSLHSSGMKVIADVVLNHKLGGDEQEKIPVKRVHPENRTEPAGEEEIIDAWTKFTFPGRNGKYSTYEWDWHSFTGVSENSDEIYLILNEHSEGNWDDMLEDELGNYDYLMGADIEFRNEHVREELKHWGQWYVETTDVDGFRLDAVKHISHHFYNDWLDHLNKHYAKDFLCIGEYWRSQAEPLLKYIEATDGRVQLFDVPLHFNFHRASTEGGSYDMSKILDGSLLNAIPTHSITFVDNHDTQPLQSLQSPVEQWFKPLAYAIILLREQGLPCVFFPAFYGANYQERKGEEDITVELPKVHCLEQMLLLRKETSYGLQRDYFDHGNTIGWTREGTDEKDGSGIAVVLTNGSAGHKTMEMGKRHAGKKFRDITGGFPDMVEVNEEGWGEFYVNDRSFSIWVREDAISKLSHHG